MVTLEQSDAEYAEAYWNVEVDLSKWQAGLDAWGAAASSEPPLSGARRRQRKKKAPRLHGITIFKVPKGSQKESKMAPKPASRGNLAPKGVLGASGARFSTILGSI